MIEQEHDMATTPETTGYQGWANYPTWAVHLWVANTEGLYDAAQGVLADAGEPVQGARDLREWIEDQNPIEDASMFADILDWALQIVDWDTVARALGPDEWDEPVDPVADTT